MERAAGAQSAQVQERHLAQPHRGPPPDSENGARGAAPRALSGLPDGRGLNIAYEAVDRHAPLPTGSKVAIRWLGRHGEVRDLSYAELRELSDRFALVLRSLGVEAGDRVFALCGRTPELHLAALGTFKARGIFCPLFSAFGPEPIEARVAIGQPKVLLTTDALYRRKVEALRGRVPSLEHVLILAEDGRPVDLPGTADARALMAAAGGGFTIPATDPEDPALLHFTSGTTGLPKGALHVHGAVRMHHPTAQ